VLRPTIEVQRPQPLEGGDITAIVEPGSLIAVGAEVEDCIDVLVELVEPVP